MMESLRKLEGQNEAPMEPTTIVPASLDFEAWARGVRHQMLAHLRSKTQNSKTEADD
jgi:hypothetical protein